jgi:SAM-dependent methyltransferase
MKISKKKTLLRLCPICGSNEGEVLHTQRFVLPQNILLPAEYDVVSCVKCGFTYADTSAHQQDYDQYYKSQSIYEDQKIGRGSGGSDHDRKRLSDTVDEIARSCPDKTASIIDVGCANGGLLRLLKEKGYTNLTGVDPSERCVETILSYGMAGVQGAIFEANKLLNGQKFDYVILSHVMEHIYDLKKAIHVCFSLMNENGKLYIEVPDAARYSDYYIESYHHFNTEHINHFDNVSLTNLGAMVNLSKWYAGHKIIPISSNYLYPAVFIVFEKAKAIDNVLHISTEARKSIEKYLALSAKNSNTEIILELVKTQEEIYVFGAGAFTFRLLATTDLPKCNIKAFIDNDSKKVTKTNIREVEGGGNLLINKHVQMPDVLAGFTGTLVICSVQFAQEITAQVKSINPHLKIIVLE